MKDNDFFRKLEEFEKMINSNFEFNKTFGKIKQGLQESLSSENGWDINMPLDENKDLLSLTLEMD
jgi:hypothetical protein